MEKKKGEETRNPPNLVSKIFNIFGCFCTSTLHVISPRFVKCRMIAIWAYVENLGPF